MSNGYNNNKFYNLYHHGDQGPLILANRSNNTNTDTAFSANNRQFLNFEAPSRQIQTLGTTSTVGANTLTFSHVVAFGSRVPMIPNTIPPLTFSHEVPFGN